MSLRVPAPPNNGTVLFCGANEYVTVTSSPFLSNDNSGCYFHYPYEWDAPSGWNWQQGYSSPNNSSNLNKLAYYSDNNTLVSPGSVSNGNNGVITVTALWNNSYWPAYGGSFNTNTSSSGILWVGPPSVSNGLVNGSPGGTPTYVPSGYANLSVNITGGGSTNWYVANGSGSLSPSGNYCSVSFSNFVRVVVDANNRCGAGGSWTFYLTTQQGYSGYRIAPNPAKDQVSVLMEMKEMAGELIQTVELYNEKSKLCKSTGQDKLKAGKYDKTSIDLDVKDLPRGTYFLHVKMNDTINKHQILLE